MKFVRENFDNIVKLIVYQIGTAIFSLFLYTAAGAISADNTSSLLIKVGISVFSILFYFMLIYTTMWEDGAKDRIRIDAGRLTKNSFKGAGISFFANIINFVITGIAVLLMAIYMLGGSEGFKSAFNILNLIFRLLLSVYLGAVQGIFIAFENDVDLYFFLQSIGFLVFPVITIIWGHISYNMGLAEKRLFGFLSKK